MSTPSDFSFQEEESQFHASLPDAADTAYDPDTEHWDLALSARDRWLKGEEKTFTLTELKAELGAELGWKS
ncbi:MAG TPA: hypothetical protein VGE29_05700 [Prosthecobacter sp.]